MLLLISQEMSLNGVIYDRLFRKWLRTVKIDKAEHQQCMECFNEELVRLTGMQIDYDSDMGSVLAKLVREAYRESQGKQLTPESSWIISNLLHIMRMLFLHLLIGKNEVREILEHVCIKQAEIIQFLESTVMPVQIRWDSCVPYEIELFRFIAPFKGISRSLQMAIDDQFKQQSYLSQRFEESEDPSWLKQSKSSLERVREQHEDRQKTRQSISRPKSNLHLSSFMNLDISVIQTHEEEYSEISLNLDD